MADLRIVDAPEIPTEDITGAEKLPTGGSGNYSISLDSLADYTKTKKDLADNTTVNGKVNGVRQELATHIEDLLNPHQVTKGQIGLGNVDNTADADKPVSNSTQAAIISAVSTKADKSYVDNQLAIKANKSDVYTKSETYTKQESNDLVNSSISTALTPINNSLALVKRGVANRYDSSLTYNSGERVVLTNGDIVKSTIDGNTNDPNVDMTGWVKTNSASQIFDESGVTQQEINDKSITTVDSIADLIAIQNPRGGQVVFVKSYYAGLNKGYGAFYYNGTDWVRISNKGSLEGYGLRGDGITNDQATIALGQAAKVPLTIESKEVYTPIFLADFNCNLDGNNTTVYVNSSLGESVSVQIRDGSRLSNIKFDNSRSGSHSWSYSGIRNNVYLKNVGFYGFRDDVPLPNSWGVLLTEVKDIVFNNCHFGNNSQSDIAFTDNIKNITLNNLRNDLDGGVSLNFEPNDIRPIENVQVIGGEYRLVQILENNYLSTSIRGLTFTGALIKDLIYDGGDVVFTNTQIKNIRNEVIQGVSYSGSMRCDSIHLGKNLIKDPYIFDVANSQDTSSFWSVFAPFSNAYSYGYNDNDGRYLHLNSNEVNNEVQFITRDFIPVGDKFMLATSMAGSGQNLSSLNMYIYFYDSLGSQIGDPLMVSTVRGNATEKLKWNNNVLFVDSPASTTKIKILFRNQPTASLKVRAIGVYDYTHLQNGCGNMNTTLDVDIYNTLPKNLTYTRDTMWVKNLDAMRPTPFQGDKVVIPTFELGAIREVTYTNNSLWIPTLKNSI